MRVTGPRRARLGVRIFAGAVLIGVVGTLGWWMLGESGATDRIRGRALRAAVDEGGAAVAAAHRPLEVRRRQTDREDESSTARWKQGATAELSGKLAPNQSVFEALRERGVPAASIDPVVKATGARFDFRRSRPGDRWRAVVGPEGTIRRFRYRVSARERWETVREAGGGYHCRRVDVPTERRRGVLAGTIRGSLWGAMVGADATPRLIESFAGIFGYSIDFNREVRSGDRFAMVVEKIYVDGEFVEYGPLLAAAYAHGGTVYRAFRWKSNGGEAGYYNADGKNMKRQFLKSPIGSVRITSGFGQRYHPVLGREKMHRGVDYGAPRGTPVRAVADGEIEFAGPSGASGNLVVIDHPKGYETLYAHLSDIADRLDPGDRIDKETVIGEVGSTGRSTGPHLHFGMKRHGQYVDPTEVESERAPPLTGEERRKFQDRVVEPLRDRLDAAIDGRAEATAVAAHGRPAK
ncbi:MAG: M23 family metallopeptidase [Bradymonadaceae bacterium]